MEERFTDKPALVLQDKAIQGKKAPKLSFLKEKGALKKWFIATEIIGLRER